MDLSVITVTFNSNDYIGQQLASVKDGAESLLFEQIIIDNGSNDGTVSAIKTGFSGVQVIANERNIGFGAANMQGVARAKGRYLLFLNPDMRVERGSLDTLVQWMDARTDVGIASPKLIDERGQVNWDATPRRFPKLWEQLAIVLKLPHVFEHMLDKYRMRDFDPDKQQEVDSVRGSFMLMRRELVDKLGWAFDPRYVIWYEDVDVCREAKKHGFKVVYTPIISAIDYVGQSFKKRTTLWRQAQFTKSMLQYWKKWEPWYKWMWIAVVRPFGIGLAWAGGLRRRSK
jgi:O-antigen biosynthesis protein